MFALLKREILLSIRAGGSALTGVLFFLAVVSAFPFAQAYLDWTDYLLKNAKMVRLIC